MALLVFFARNLNRAASISTIPSSEKPIYNQKFENADHPHRFINSLIKNLNEEINESEDCFIQEKKNP